MPSLLGRYGKLSLLLLNKPMKISLTRAISVTAHTLTSTKITSNNIITTKNMMAPTSGTTMTPAKMTPARELTLQCSDGMVLAAQQWYSKASPLDDREGETRVSSFEYIYALVLKY